jgi:uroporphyrinogen decarboxylase
MNSLERVFATVGGQPKDRPAFVMNLSLYGSKLAGVPLQDYYTDANAYAEGQMAVREVFGPDLLLSPFLVPAIGEAFGSEVTACKQQVPNIRRFAAASALEAMKLPLPDVDSHPRLVYLRETIRILSARYQGEVPVVGVLVSPVDIPPLVIGIEAWLEALLSEPDTARALMDRWGPFCVDLANAMLGDGATLIAATANFANPTIVPPRVTQGIARPALEAAFGAIKGPIILHHGGAQLAPHLMGYLGLPNVAAYFVDARDSLAEARQNLGETPVLIGNLHAPSLECETPESVRGQCEAILADRAGDTRFLFGTSAADVPLATPPEVLQAIVDTICHAGIGAA